MVGLLSQSTARRRPSGGRRYDQIQPRTQSPGNSGGLLSQSSPRSMQGGRTPGMQRERPTAPSRPQPKTDYLGAAERRTAGMGPVLGQVEDNQLSTHHLDRITRENSPLMKRARTQGMQYANSRGLLSSSMGAEASMGAMIDRARDFAISDATAYREQSRANQDAQNLFIRDDRDFIRSGALQSDQQQFTSGENRMDRDLTRSEGRKGRNLQRDLQVDDQSFRSSESRLTRSHEAGLARERQDFERGENAATRDLTRGENAADRDLTVSEGLLDREFRGSENAADRELTTTENAADRDLTRSESAHGRAHEQQMQDALLRFEQNEAEFDRALATSENGLDRELQQRLQDGDHAFMSGESQEDRALQERMKLLDQAFRGDQNALDRLLEEKLQQQNQSWRGGENELDRRLTERMQERDIASRESESEKDRGLTVSENQLDREQQQGLQDDQQDFISDESALDREQQTSLQDDQQDFVSGESALGREHETSLQDDQQGFVSGESALDREQQTRLQDDQQGFISGESALDREQQTRLQDDQQGFISGENTLDREHEAGLQQTDIEYREAEGRRNRALQKYMNDSSNENRLELQQAQNAFEASQRDLDRVLQQQGYETQLDIAELSANTSLTTAQLNADTSVRLAQYNNEQEYQRLNTSLEAAANENDLARGFQREMEGIRQNSAMAELEAQHGFRLEEIASSGDVQMDSITLQAYSNLSNVIMDGAADIMADADLNSYEKTNAIANLYDVANSSLAGLTAAGSVEFPDYELPENPGGPPAGALPPDWRPNLPGII